jgi:hypothetical protein
MLKQLIIHKGMRPVSGNSDQLEWSGEDDFHIVVDGETNDKLRKALKAFIDSLPEEEKPYRPPE